MRNNSKGFTLIELLAVIVILAIIALITTPIILNVIEQSRRNAAVDKAWGTIDAIRVAYAQAQVDSDPVGIPFTVNFPKGDNKGTQTTDWGTVTATGGGYGKGFINNQAVSASGEMPQGGYATIQADGNIIAYKLKFGQYYCTTMEEGTDTFDSNSMFCSRTESDVELDSADDPANFVGGSYVGKN